MFKRLAFIFLFTPFLAFPQKEIPYQVGEYSAFDISFGSIVVGHAELEIVEEKLIDSISTLHIVGKGKTASFFDWFFKVRDVYETFLDTSKMLPIKFIRDINEGSYSKKQNYFLITLMALYITTILIIKSHLTLKTCYLHCFMHEPLIRKI